MPVDDFKAVLKAIVVLIDLEQYPAALASFKDLFTDPTVIVPEEHVEEINLLFFKTLEKIPLVQKIVFVKQISSSKNIPAKLCRRLLKEAPMISAPLLERTQISSKELIEIISEGDKQKLLSIANRSSLSEEVTSVMVKTGNIDVLAAVAANPNAKLSRDSIEMLVEVAVVEPTMDGALSKRSDLPPDLARRLSRPLTAEARDRVDEILETEKMRKRREFVLR